MGPCGIPVTRNSTALGAGRALNMVEEVLTPGRGPGDKGQNRRESNGTKVITDSYFDSSWQPRGIIALIIEAGQKEPNGI